MKHLRHAAVIALALILTIGGMTALYASATNGPEIGDPPVYVPSTDDGPVPCDFDEAVACVDGTPVVITDPTPVFNEGSEDLDPGIITLPATGAGTTATNPRVGLCCSGGAGGHWGYIYNCHNGHNDRWTLYYDVTGYLRSASLTHFYGWACDANYG